MKRPFPFETNCPKCWSSDKSAQFYAKGENKRIWATDKTPPDDGFKHTIGWSEAKRDLILAHCRCCHYEWCMDPMS